MSNEVLPGTYSRIGTEQDPGSFRTGGSAGSSMKMPPNIVKDGYLNIIDGIIETIGFQVENFPYHQSG